MKTHKRSKVSDICALLLLIIIPSLLSCKKEEPQKFSTDSFLYFIDQFSNSFNATSMQYVYKPEVQFSFLQTLYQMDTLEMNKISQLPLSIQFDGKVSDQNRKIKLELEGNGKEYCILPNVDSMYIPANGVEYQFNLKIVRPPLSDTTMKTVTLTLKNTSDFSPENHTWNTVTFKFGNWFERPLTYGNVASTYGDFSPAKMATMQLAVEREGSVSWEADPNVIILNDFLKNLNQRQVKFNPFTADELYHFMDSPPTWIDYYQPTGPVRDAYNAITAKIIQLSKAVIIEKRAAGDPILDGSGREISFP